MKKIAKKIIVAVSLFFVGVIFFSVLAVFAKEKTEMAEDSLRAFVWMKDVPVPAITIPTVVEAPIDESTGNEGFAVFEETTKTFQPSLFKESIQFTKVAFSVEALGKTSQIFSDGDATNFIEFPVSDERGATAELRIHSMSPIAATGLMFSLDRFVALPRTIEVRAIVDGTERIVLASSMLNDRVIRFPKVSAAEWTVRFGYVQPLRITGLSFFEEDNAHINSAGVRFLARPGERYRLYLGTDRLVPIRVGERPNLFDDRDVVRIADSEKVKNPLYVPVDTDEDGVKDLLDNCVFDKNSDQKDENSNGRGDVCDDYDHDGIANGKDNCMSYPNSDQRDTDGDGKGDICDSEESRVLEKYSWLSWAGISLAGIVVAILFALTMRQMKRNK